MTTPYMRSFVVEQVNIKPGDGRTVEAYAAVFNSPAQVHDPDGEYEEVIDPGAFNRTLEHRRRAKGGAAFPVLFNHGRTLFGTPSERYSVPIGVSEEVRVDGNGLFTRSRFHKTQAADEVLEAIKDGSITGYSFRGEFLRSEPVIPHGGFRRGRNGELKTVHRTELTLDEYGPGTFPVYQGAEIVGVRAAATLLSSYTPEEAIQLLEMFRSGTLSDSPDDGTSSDEDPAAEDPPVRHSIRSIKQELQAERARFLIRQGASSA